MRCLLVSLLILCITCTTKAEEDCNDSEDVKCTCNHGYTGTKCETEINWCHKPLDVLHMNVTFHDICSVHGTCTSHPTNGASCVCDDGFHGTLCLEANPSEVFCGLRCLLYEPPDPDHPSNVTVGCADASQRCISDNLDCVFGPKCLNPIGWCVPEAH